MHSASRPRCLNKQLNTRPNKVASECMFQVKKVEVFHEYTSLQANYFLIWSLAGGREKSLGDYVPTSSKMKIKDSARLRQQRFNFHIHNPAFTVQCGWRILAPPKGMQWRWKGGRRELSLFFSSGEVQLTGISAQLLIRRFIRALITQRSDVLRSHQEMLLTPFI